MSTEFGMGCACQLKHMTGLIEHPDSLGLIHNSALVDKAKIC